MAAGYTQMAMENLSRQPQPIGKVFIQRDYSEGTQVRFHTKLPADLCDRIDQSTFESTINRLNEIYADAESLGARTYMEGCFSCMTAYTLLLCMETHYDKCLKKAALYLQQQNDEVYVPRGLLITDPFERGLRVIEIAILPHDRGSHP
ncbi:golgin subfamily A member 7-like isoform X2 [Amphiura filiformis]|uniref:golgin subfamily A member 7-like isoform X2 n=1 Tax=Amphiura filiformis TaxID=82378 RepID=UPI003B21ADB2